MSQRLSLTQLTLLVGGILLLGVLFVFLIYFVHKLFQRQQAHLKPARPRSQDEAAAQMGMLQAVIAGMKQQEKRLEELLRDAELRAEASARALEAIGRELPVGLMMFNREGFLTLSNPAARALLGIDTWSRRRYPEILGPESLLASHIQDCLETGKTCKGEVVEYRTVRGETRTLEISLTPCYARGGRLEGALCLLTERAEDRGHNS